MLEDNPLTRDCQLIEDMSKLKLSRGVCDSHNRTLVLLKGKCVNENYRSSSLAVNCDFLNYRLLLSLLMMMHVVLGDGDVPNIGQ